MTLTDLTLVTRDEAASAALVSVPSADASSRVTSVRSVRVTTSAYLNIDNHRYSRHTLNIDERQYTKDHG